MVGERIGIQNPQLPLSWKKENKKKPKDSGSLEGKKKEKEKKKHITKQTHMSSLYQCCNTLQVTPISILPQYNHKLPQKK